MIATMLSIFSNHMFRYKLNYARIKQLGANILM